MNEKARQGIALFLEGLGIDAAEDGLMKTPERVADLYADLFSGRGRSSREVWGEIFPTEYKGLVGITRIPYYSVCEHHLMPFYGTVDIVYQPFEGRVAGLSKLGKLVELYARRPQLQERLTGEIADAIERDLKAEGVIVQLSGIHLCMLMRGEMEQDARVVTSESRGVLLRDGALREEALMMIRGGRGNVQAQEL